MHDIPEEAVKAAIDAFHEAWNNNQGLDNELPAYAHRAALTAALPFLPVQGAVKKLEWVATGQTGFLETEFYAVAGSLMHTVHPLKDVDGAFYEHYSIHRDWNDREMWRVTYYVGNNGLSGISKACKSLEAAKAAAQADYSARILSALEPSAARELVLEPDFWAVHSKTGVHVGLWPNKAHADEALREYEGGTITPLYRATPTHQEGFRQGIDAAAKIADYFEETIYSEGMSEDVYYGINCTVSQIAREIRALSSQDHAEAGRVEGDGWLPIESAPKDGTPVLAYQAGRYFKCWMECDQYEGGYFWQDEEDSEPSPTHWRPLPTPPSSEVA